MITRLLKSAYAVASTACWSAMMVGWVVRWGADWRVFVASLLLNAAGLIAGFATLDAIWGWL